MDRGRWVGERKAVYRVVQTRLIEGNIAEIVLILYHLEVNQCYGLKKLSAWR